MEIGSDPTLVPYSHCSSCPKSNTLRLGVALSNDVPAGTVVRAFAFTATPGPVDHVVEAIGQGGGCSVAAERRADGVWLLLIGGALAGICARRRTRSTSAARAHR